MSEDVVARFHRSHALNQEFKNKYGIEINAKWCSDLWRETILEVCDRNGFHLLNIQSIKENNLPYNDHVRRRGAWVQKGNVVGFLKACLMVEAGKELLISRFAKAAKLCLPEVIVGPLADYSSDKVAQNFAFCFSPVIGTSPKMLSSLSREPITADIDLGLSKLIPFQVYFQIEDAEGINIILPVSYKMIIME